jgi:hypothetical protein
MMAAPLYTYGFIPEMFDYMDICDCRRKEWLRLSSRACIESLRGRVKEAVYLRKGAIR